MNEHRSVKEVVNDLGSLTTQEIEEFFRSEGVKGFTGSWDSCPVAGYIAKETGVRVGVTYTDGVEDAIHSKLLVRNLPQSVEAFINNFDSGGYSDLVDRNDPFFWKGKNNA